MITIRKTTSGNTAFIIADLAPRYHEVVQGFFYSPVEEGFAKTYPNDTPHLDRIYANFERYAEEMILQTAGERPILWEKSLLSFCEITAGVDIDWWLTGSAALAVRGLDVGPRDLDLVVDEPGAYRLSELLLDYLVEPLQPSPGWIWDNFCRAFLYARLEWIGGVNPNADQPEMSDFGPGAAAQLDVVNWQGAEIRVPPLELQLQVNKRRGLAERVAKIETFLQS